MNRNKKQYYLLNYLCGINVIPRIRNLATVNFTILTEYWWGSISRQYFKKQMNELSSVRVTSFCQQDDDPANDKHCDKIYVFSDFKRKILTWKGTVNSQGTN